MQASNKQDNDSALQSSFTAGHKQKRDAAATNDWNKVQDIVKQIKKERKGKPSLLIEEKKEIKDE